MVDYSAVMLVKRSDAVVTCLVRSVVAFALDILVPCGMIRRSAARGEQRVIRVQPPAKVRRLCRYGSGPGSTLSLYARRDRCRE